MNSLVMTSSTWLKSALCSSDRTGTDFRYLSWLGQRVFEDSGENVAQRTSITETPISQLRLYKEKACNIYSGQQQQQQAQLLQLISCKFNNKYD